MTCQKCGYVMDPFEESCPRCARVTAQAPPAPAPAQKSEDAEVIATLDKLMPRLKRTAERDEPIRFVPDLGWPLTIALWLVIIYQGLLVLLSLLLAVGLQIVNSEDPRVGVPALVILGTIPAIRLAAAIGMLKFQRWGFIVYTIFCIMPLALSLMAGSGIGWRNIFDVVTGAVILVLVLAKWSEFD